jgi:hypothetical protein
VCAFSGMHADVSHAAYSEIFSILSSVYVLPRSVGATLFDAAARIPGVVVLRHVTDAAGGRGIAVAMSGRTMAGAPASSTRVLRYELIFNPQTYRFIGLQTVTIGGIVMQAQAINSAHVANSAPKVNSIALWGDQGNCIA